MKIVYVGTKEVKGDNVAATGLTWRRGEVHEVMDEKKCAKLLEHKLIWQNADGKSAKQVEAMLLPELKSLPPDPIVRVVPNDDAFMDAFVLPVPVAVLRELHNKTLTAVFMKPADADAFADWKLERETAPDTAPRNTGPKDKGLKNASAPKKVA